MSNICPECGNVYEKVSIHWTQSSCPRPSLSNHQREIITGLLMGDGTLNRGSKNPSIQVECISPDYLSHIDGEFGILGTSVTQSMTAKDNAERVRKSGFSPNANEENYSDKYRWNSVRHPEIGDFEYWYKSGKKIWPSDIELTPTVLKHWYCGDGYLGKTGPSKYITISMSNEIDNTQKVSKLFEDSGLPTPQSYDIHERKDGSKMCQLRFGVEESKVLFEHMGNPLPDFRYKFPE